MLFNSSYTSACAPKTLSCVVLRDDAGTACAFRSSIVSSSFNCPAAVSFTMSDIADILSQSQYVHDSLNRDCFMFWVTIADEKEIDAVMDVVYMVSHCFGPLEQLFPTAPITFFREDLGRTWTMAVRQCEDLQCQRCTNAFGGWHFRWIGPWTCPNIVGDENTSAADLLNNGMRCSCGRHEIF